MIEDVDFTPPATAQFLSALSYIRSERPVAAQDFRVRVEKALSHLITFPDSGRIIPEYPNLGYREVLVDKYRFFYKPVGRIVWVVGVWNDAQIPDQPAELTGI